MHIYIDTREKNPLDFSFYNVETSIATIKTGDYSLEGYQDLIFIERKASTSELYNNLIKNYTRFQRELDRAKDCKYKYIICEFHYTDLLTFPKNSGMPFFLQKRLRASGSFLRRRVMEVEEKYDVIFLYCGTPDMAASKVIEIFEEIESHEKV